MYRKIILLFLAILLCGEKFLCSSFSTEDVDHCEVMGIISDVLTAVDRMDFELLAKTMASDFKYSFGDIGSKANAIDHYRINPHILKEMKRIIYQGCKYIKDDTVTYVCPPAFGDPSVIYFDYRAGFRKRTDGKWEFIFFIAGE